MLDVHKLVFLHGVLTSLNSKTLTGYLVKTPGKDTSTWTSKTHVAHGFQQWMEIVALIFHLMCCYEMRSVVWSDLSIWSGCSCDQKGWGGCLMRSVSCCLVCIDNDDGERVGESSKWRILTQRALRSPFVFSSVCVCSQHMSGQRLSQIIPLKTLSVYLLHNESFLISNTMISHKHLIVS